MEINKITGEIVDAAMKVHSVLGPGLLESTYEICLAHELRCRGLQSGRQVSLPIQYNEIVLDAGYRIDLLVAQSVIVELKSVEKMIPLYDAQLLAYLKLSKIQVGFLINFNVTRLKDGIKRMVNNFPE